MAFTFGAERRRRPVLDAGPTAPATPEPLLENSPTVKHPNGFSPDGRFLIYDDHTTQRQDLWVLPITAPPNGERKPIPFVVTQADETFGQFSPDGQWIAYSSDESGRREVYVQGFAPDRVPAAAGGKWQMSTAGGDKPRWSRDGKELYYIAPDRKLMAVPVTLGPPFQPGVAVPLFETTGHGVLPLRRHPDGRFLVSMPAAGRGDDFFAPDDRVELAGRLEALTERRDIRRTHDEVTPLNHGAVARGVECACELGRCGAAAHV